MPYSRIVNGRDRFENLKVMKDQIMESYIKKKGFLQLGIEQT